MDDLRTSVMRGSAWMLVGFALSQTLRLASNIALAALLFEKAFALMAIVNAIVQGLAMFTDVGIGTSVVQNKRGDERNFLDTAWTLKFIRGLFLALLTSALAWPVAAYYAQNDSSAWELVWLLPLVSIATLVAGLQSTKLWTATRHMNLKVNTLIELTSQVVGLAFMLGVAYLTASVYAFPIGAIASAVTLCLLSHLAIPGPGNRFAMDRAALHAIFHFGKWMFVSTAITFLALQLDKLVLARMFSLDQVGVYAIAANLALLAPTVLGRLQSMVAFPLYSRTLHNNGDLHTILDRSKLPMIVLGSVIVCLFAVCAESFVRIAYDARYADAGTYVTILVAGAWFAMVDGIYGAAFLAAGRALWVAAINAVKVASFCLLLYPAASHFGMLGAVAAVAASDVIKLTLTIWFARRVGLRGQRLEVLFLCYTVAVFVGATYLTRHSGLTKGWHEAAILALQSFIVLIGFSPHAYKVYRLMWQRRLQPTQSDK